MWTIVLNTGEYMSCEEVELRRELLVASESTTIFSKREDVIWDGAKSVNIPISSISYYFYVEDEE